MPAHYPFCRIIGQPLLKTALLLVSADPEIGGLLISGPRGSAKTTIVRGLSDLQKNKPFVTLPLGATEEMITGSIDLESALGNSEVKFRPGLLSRADNGILYVDEVNLLFDHLVDLLLDAAASGINIVERDDISCQHDSSFVLIGTMNPDEGELRPQLLDRFGLMVEMETRFSIEQRRQVVRNRLAFDRNPKTFINDSQIESDAIRQQIEWAADNLQRVRLSDHIETGIAKRCADAGVDGMRADIIFHRSAIACCALDQRLEVTINDLDMVEPLVLSHRRNIHASDAGKAGGNISGNNDSGQNSHNGGSQGDSSQSGSSIQGSWGAMQPVSVRSLPGIPLPLPPQKYRREFPETTRDHNSGQIGNRNRHGLVRAAKYSTGNSIAAKKIDWVNTLRRTARFGLMSYQARQQSLKFKHKLPGAINLDLIVLDTSASTLNGQGLGCVQGSIQTFSEQSYRTRRHLGIVTFGNDTVHTLLQPQRAPKNIGPLLDQIQAGGGTPISKALNYIDDMLTRQKYRNSCHIYLITDGRFDDAVAEHRSIHSYPVTLVDIEHGRVPLGRSRQLARQINARYLHISNLSA